MLEEIGASHEAFLLAAKKGLESKEDKKYFEQLIMCSNYLYFKNMMTRRNLQIEEQAYKLMQDKLGITDVPDMKLREETELECAIQMSLALEDEKRRLMEIEDEELRVNFI